MGRPRPSVRGYPVAQMDEETRQQVELMKPRRGALLLLIPVSAVLLVIGLWIVALAFGVYGRPADGDRVVFTWSACPEAQAVVAHRATGMGLGNPVFTSTASGFSLEARLPADPDVAARIPITLATPATLSAHVEGTPSRVLLTNADIEGAAIRQDITLSPWTVLTLTPKGLEALRSYVREQRDGKVVYTLDGQPIGTVSNLKGAALEVELTPSAPTEKERLHAAAERAILLDSGPLPCPVTP